MEIQLTIDGIIQKNASSVFLMDHDKRITYQQFGRYMYCVSAQLDGAVCKGAIAWCGSKNFLFYIVVLACLRLGRPIFIFHNSWSAEQMRATIHKYKIPNLLLEENSSVYKKIDCLPFVDTNVYTISGNDGDWCITARGICRDKSFGYFDADVYLATSGSTGIPKWVGLSNEFIFENMLAFGKRLGIKKGDCIFAALPLYTSNGMTITLFLPFCFGITVYIGPDFNPFVLKDFLNKASMLQNVILSLVPSIVYMINKVAWGQVLKQKLTSCTRFCICGTAPLSSQQKVKFETQFCIPIYTNYGLTETLFVATQNSYDHDDTSVGTILDNVDVLFDKNEIMIKRTKNHAVYLGDDKNDIFFPTGDLGSIQNGKLFVWGRKKQTVIRGGYNIDLTQLEQFFLSLDFITDCVCFGMDDSIGGEEVFAAVVINKEKFRSEVLTMCMNKYLSRSIKPKILFLKSIPRTEIGKPIFCELRNLVKNK